MRLHVYAISMTNRFRGTTVREGVLFEGSAGWAEFSPFPEYGIREAAAWWRAAEASAHTPWPKARRSSIRVNSTVPAVGPVAAGAIIARNAGCTTAKVKVAEPGQSLQDDLDRVAAVRDTLGPGGRIRIDANGAWSVSEAVEAIGKIDRVAGGLEYVEQPCADVADLARVRRKVGVLIAADESIRRSDDPLAVVRAEAADVAVLKVQPLGGVASCLRIAEEIGLPVVVSSAVETSVGLAAGIALAAALPELPFACGLGTASLLARDVVAEPLLPVGGALPVGRVVVDPERLDLVSADPATTRSWIERVAAVREAAAS